MWLWVKVRIFYPSITWCCIRLWWLIWNVTWQNLSAIPVLFPLPKNRMGFYLVFPLRMPRFEDASISRHLLISSLDLNRGWCLDPRLNQGYVEYRRLDSNQGLRNLEASIQINLNQGPLNYHDLIWFRLRIRLHRSREADRHTHENLWWYLATCDLIQFDLVWFGLRMGQF